MKAIKISVWIIMVVIVILGGGVLVITNLVDPNDYKPAITRMVAEKTGRQLELVGDLELTFFPWLGVETGALILYNAPGFGDQPMLEVGNARASVKFVPLLSRQVEIDTILLDSPRVRLTIQADGRSNWDDLVVKLAGDGVNDSSNSAQGAGAIAGLAINGISLIDGLLELDDGESGKNLTLKALNLSTGALIPGTPLEIEFSVNASGSMLPESADIVLNTTLTLSDNRTSLGLESTGFSIDAKSIKAGLTVDKIFYAVDSGLAAINGIMVELEQNGNSARVGVPSLNFDPSAQTLEMPSMVISQGESRLESSVSARNVLSSPAANGSFKITSPDVLTLLKQFGVADLLPAEILIGGMNTSGRYLFENDIITLENFMLESDLNKRGTRFSSQELNYDIGRQNISLTDFNISQGDFSASTTLKGEGILADNGPDLLSGQLQLTIENLEELLLANGFDVDLSEIVLSDVALDTAFEFIGSRIRLNNLDASFEYFGQPSKVTSPVFEIDLNTGAIVLESLNVKQQDLLIQAEAAGAGVLGEFDVMTLSGSLSLEATGLTGLLARNKLPVELSEGLVNDLFTSLRFSLGDNVLNVSNLRANADETEIAGSVSLINLNDPAYKFDLDISQLDLDKLTVSQEPGQNTESAQNDLTQPDTAEQLILPVAALQGLVIDGKARIGRLATTGLIFDNVSMAVRSDKNILKIDPVTANVVGGSIEAAITYDVSSNTPTIAFENTTRNVDVGELLSVLEVTDKVEGRGELGVDLNGTGMDLDGVLASLGGDIDFRLSDGALKGFDLQAALLKLEEQLADYRGTEMSAREKPEAETRFTELSGSFKASGGKFKNDDLAMKAPAFRVGGAGVIDLPRSQIDYNLDVNVVSSVEGQGGQSLDELKGTHIPFRISGPLEGPHFTLDVARILKDQAKKEATKLLSKELGLEDEDQRASDSPNSDSPGSSKEAEIESTKDPKEELKDQLKKDLTKGLLKSLGLD
jgi:AsmA protein